MEKVPYVDQSGMYAIEDAVLQLDKRGVMVLIVGIQDQPLSMLKGIRLIPELIPAERVFSDFETLKEYLVLFGVL